MGGIRCGTEKCGHGGVGWGRKKVEKARWVSRGVEWDGGLGYEREEVGMGWVGRREMCGKER